MKLSLFRRNGWCFFLCFCVFFCVVFVVVFVVVLIIVINAHINHRFLLNSFFKVGFIKKCGGFLRRLLVRPGSNGNVTKCERIAFFNNFFLLAKARFLHTLGILGENAR